MRIRKILRNLFKDTEYKDRIEEIYGVVVGEEKSAKIIYLNSLHLFGRKGGLEVYNKIKSSGELKKR